MALDKNYTIGKDCALYYGTAWATPAWTLVPNVQDVTFPSLTKGKVDLMRRGAGGWKGKGAGFKECALEFGYLYEGTVDTVFEALRDAYLNDTPLIFFVSDKVIANTASSVDCEGFRFPALVFDFPINQELEAGQTVKIGVEYTPVKESGTALYPAWYSIAGTAS